MDVYVVLDNIWSSIPTPAQIDTSVEDKIHRICNALRGLTVEYYGSPGISQQSSARHK